jgi:putative copper export protein
MIAAKIINNFLHLSATVAWIGGMINQLFVLMPSLKKAEPQVSAQIMGVNIRRFRILTVVCIVILVVTGGFLTLWRSAEGISIISTYGIILLVKHAYTLAIIILGLIAGFYTFPKMEKLTQKKEEPVKISKCRRCLTSFLITNTILGIIILLLTVMLPFYLK